MTGQVFIDSNVFIYFQTRDTRNSEKAYSIVEKLIKSEEMGVFTPYVLNEVHYSVLRSDGQNKASKLIKDIFESDYFMMIDVNFDSSDIKKIIKISNKYNIKTFDAFHAYSCKKLGIKKIATFDKDFHKIKWLKIYT